MANIVLIDFPTLFSIIKKENTLYANRILENRDMTAATLAE